MKSRLKTTDEWARRRIRAVYWKLWKKIKTKYKMLKALGVEHWKEKELACSRKGYFSLPDYYLIVYDLCAILQTNRNNELTILILRNSKPSSGSQMSYPRTSVSFCFSNVYHFSQISSGILPAI